MVSLILKKPMYISMLVLCLSLLPMGTRATQAPIKAEAGPGISAVTSNLGDYTNFQVPKYEKLELTLTLDTEYDNPFDPEIIRIEGQFRSPSQEMLIQPGFFYQDYEVNLVNGVELYAPLGDPVWKIRFTPREVGSYEYSIQAIDANGTTTTQNATFEVIESSNPGFIGVSEINQRYFEFENGMPFIGIGLNVSWWQFENRRITTYNYYFNRMNENKANLARVWMTNSGKDQDWILSIQDDTLGDKYNLEEAWAFDQIMDVARERGVYLLLTLEDVNQYTYNWADNLYNSLNGGPISYRSALFTNLEARKYQERIIRYIIARWGYSPTILSWELFNEINELEWSDPGNWNRSEMIDWHAEMGTFIRSIDIHHHMVNTSTGSFKTHPDLYGLSQMDFAEMHFYYVPGCCEYAPSDPAGRDMADLTRYYAHLTRGSVTDKPSLIGEWGILNQTWNDSPYLNLDEDGIHLHNGLWSALMSGMATTGLSWHWQAHRVHDPEWWRNYQVIGEYFQDIQIAELTVMKPLNVDFSLPNGEDPRPEAFSSTNPELRVMGLRGGEEVYGWIQNRMNAWWNAVHQTAPIPQSGTISVLNLTANKRYRVEWWETHSTTQATITSEMLTTEMDGSLELSINDLEQDIAFKIQPDSIQQTWLPFIRMNQERGGTHPWRVRPHAR